MKLSELNATQRELLQRFAKHDDPETFKGSLEWIESGLTPVKTKTAFELARGGRDVFAIYADGTDTQLDDIETEAEYYADMSKSWPEIETIFVVEGEL